MSDKKLSEVTEDLKQVVEELKKANKDMAEELDK
jgi:Sec-independent protein translocase protein TatA